MAAENGRASVTVPRPPAAETDRAAPSPPDILQKVEGELAGSAVRWNDLGVVARSDLRIYSWLKWLSGASLRGMRSTEAEQSNFSRSPAALFGS